MPLFEHAPLKRHPSLQPLSRDHYQGLVQAQHLMKAANGNAQDRRKAVADFLDVWSRLIEPHFDDEEGLLVGLVHDAHRRRLLEGHRRLRELAAEGREHRRQVDPGAAWVRDLGETLNAHIRWEERELFTTLELDPARLGGLLPKATQIEASRRRGRSEPPGSSGGIQPPTAKRDEDTP
ncbi:MAG: hemerythrin domain-containing protein [Phycisphaeraceae bacterium]|nr:hemerythrin domain-containing protein [Phycisphaeraceae bacterium]